MNPPSPPDSFSTPVCSIPLSSPGQHHKERSSTPVAPPTPPSYTDWGKRKPPLRGREEEPEEEAQEGSTKGGGSQSTDDGDEHGGALKRFSSSPPKPATICEFSEDVGLSELLRKNDLGQYVPIFIEHEVDLKAFCNLKESHLMEMGLHRVGTRVRITTLIAEYCEIEARNKQRQTTHPPPTQPQQQPQQPQQPPLQDPAVPAAPLAANQAGSATASNSGQVISERSKSRPGEIPFEELVFQECIGRGSFGSVFK